MGIRMRAAVSGIVGAILAFGIVELVHGLYGGVPSVFGSLVQGIIELTPGEFATRAIELLGTADIPILIASTIIGAIVVTALIALLRLRSAVLAIIAVVVLGAVALAAVFTDPSVVVAPTVITVVAALAIGSAISESLLRLGGLAGSPTTEPSGTSGSGTSGSDSSQMAGVRRRDAGATTTQVNRRGFMTLGGLAAIVGLVLVGSGRLLSSTGSQQSADRPLQLGNQNQGGESTGEETTGASAESEVTNETLPDAPESARIEAVQEVTPLFTPAADFYLIDAALTSPNVDRPSWSLKVDGAGVSNPLDLSYNDLLSMSTREVDATLSCVSNEVGGGLVSNGRWTGVMLSDVLNEAGITRESLGRQNEQLVGRSVDGWTAGFKTDIALDGREAILAFGLNGNELPVKHGYPVRLVVPGLYGYVSATKWLQEIELTNWDFDAYWIQRSWTKEGPIKTQSRIDTVSGDSDLSAGNIPVGGVAWAPHRGISMVEVSTDDGETWNEARLADQISDDSWRQFVYEWDAPSGDHTLKVRATDGEGETQTADENPPHGGQQYDGATGYHTVQVSVA